MGAAPPDVDREAFARDMDQAFAPVLEKRISELKYEELIPTVIRGALKYNVRLPREFILILKQLLYFDRYSKLIAPKLNVFSDLFLVDFLFTPLAARYGIDVGRIAGMFLAWRERVGERAALPG
jgi:hypothetical protein